VSHRPFTCTGRRERANATLDRIEGDATCLLHIEPVCCRDRRREVDGTPSTAATTLRNAKKFISM